MLSRWMPLVPALMATLSLSSTAIAQRSVDPSSRTWRVEVDGEFAAGDHFVFVPAFFGDGTWGMWVNLEGDRPSGWGQYQWNPTAGTIDTST